MQNTPNTNPNPNSNSNLITKIVKTFLSTRLSIILIFISIALGAAALIGMPKEEDPQISVPMADIMINAPGANAQEVKNLVATPLEKLLWQVKGVEDVYSMSHNGQSVVTVKFYVGTNEEQALVRLNNQIQMHKDMIPPIVSNWIVKPITINDVPIINAVLYSTTYNDYQLRRIGDELLTQLETLPNISQTSIIGGRSLQARVELNTTRMAGFNLSPLEIYQAIQSSNTALNVGKLDQNNQQFNLEAKSFITKPTELNNLVVGVHDTKPVHLSDVATLKYGPSETSNYSSIGFSHSNTLYPAVTLALAKKGGTNAVSVANNILAKLSQLKTTLIPKGVHLSITRNYGATAHEKVTDLINSLILAIGTVVLVLIFTLGWRESAIVATSVPISFALALFVDYLFGYSINRVTLFALILSLGLVVDDPITNIENIQRHIHIGKEKIFDAILTAVNEVLPPVIMASLTIIVSFLPLFFITGMMGPYMAPMAATVPLTIIFSTVASLTVVPWMAYKLLKKQAANTDDNTTPTKEHKSYLSGSFINHHYRRLVEPFLNSKTKRRNLFLGIGALLAGCVVIVLAGGVPLQLLPFDNKDELQLVINLPEGSTLEQTNRATVAFNTILNKSKYIKSYTNYVGQPSPMDFNGMVRHYYIRQADNLSDIRVKLLPKGERSLSSHKIALLLRNPLQSIAKRYNAKLSIVEMPPGPPVLQTVVAAVTGNPSMSYQQIIAGAKHVEKLLRQEKLVVDVTDTTETPRSKISYVVDKEKAALNGISAQTINQTLQLALGTTTPLTIHTPNQRNPVPIYFELPKSERSSSLDLSALNVKGQNGNLVPLIAIGKFQKEAQNQPIMQKNLHRVVYVMANTAGKPPANVIFNMEHKLKTNPPAAGIKVNWSDEGEWKITVNVFRDMGIGFGAAMLAIYILLFIQTDSFLLPLIMMLAIPLTIIGIIPGFWLLNLIANHPVGGYPTPIFFTATSMIGMIALGGIVIRNSVILVDFIEKSLAQGVALKEAVLESGAVRFRPIVLTALTASLGAWPITLDPIFSGLAWALIFGLLASTAFTLLVVPVVYYAKRHKE